MAIHVDPDVLLVDEVLAVGDEGFTHKCLDKFAEFRRRGKTILLVTHSLGLVERFCDEALWLDEGRARAQGDPKRVVDAYLTDVEKSEEAQLAQRPRPRRVAATASAVRAAAGRAESRGRQTPVAAAGEADPTDMFQADEGRWGSREVEITGVDAARTRDGQPAHVFHSGEPMCGPAGGARARSRSTTSCSASASSTPTASAATARTPTSRRWSPTRSRGDGEVHVRRSRASISSKAPTSSTSPSTSATAIPYDYHRLLYTFRVKSRTQDVGIYRPPTSWTFSPDIRFKPDSGHVDRLNGSRRP